MADLIERDVTYTAAGDNEATALQGMLIAPSGAANGPGVVLIHDAFGLGEQMIETARSLAASGISVLLADVWGDRALPGQEEIGQYIGAMKENPELWQARIAAAHDAAREQPEIDPARLANMGYCFGGASALEYLRLDGRVIATVAVHPGLDLVEFDWQPREARVLVTLGAIDPMATAEHRAQFDAALSDAGVDWELDLYSHTKHGYTSEGAKFAPENPVIGYHERNAKRTKDRYEAFFREIFPELRPTN
ncbi:MAG: dienelactone hydrolase family protein [Gulosibacter sp.]|uniref:dienelactone hydrolase family protein n=1 Tax=Gulosibacter sp. TaxID=2817531 RepID=UPI003F93AF60